jgi:hypothetical protein
LQGNRDLTPESGALLATRLHAGILLGLCFHPEDGGDMFFLNISWI